jgi:hypothetical protein
MRSSKKATLFDTVTDMKKNSIPWMDEYEKARHSFHHSVFRTSQVRDLTLIELNDDFFLVTAVDSDGGIGPKPNDLVSVSGYDAGRFATRVPLMEILASGAVPVAAFDALAVEMEPLGREIVRGVRDELISIGLPNNFPLSGSTEDNVPTSETGMGVVIVGIVKKNDFRPGSSMKNDEVFVVGIPKSGPDDKVNLKDSDIADSVSLSRILQVTGIHDILPVGSKGILYEAGELARTADLKFTTNQSTKINLKKSAGPSTCFLVSAVPGTEPLIALTGQKPVHLIGRLT